MKSLYHITKREVLLFLSVLYIVNCGLAQNATTFKVGTWRGVLTLHEKQSEYGLIELPFNFEVKNTKSSSLEIINAEERIVVTEILLKQDSLFIKMPLYDSEFRCINYGDSLSGVWINHSRKEKNRIPFSAKWNDSSRFKIKYWTNYEPYIQGNWETTFSPTTKDQEKAIGIFKQSNVINGSILTGTFATESGDYRYLHGVQANENLFLSCFDGSHTYLFTGKVKGDSIINGQLFAGAHGHDTWVARRNEMFELHNPDSLTYLKPGYSKVDFSFKNLQGKTISLSDEKFKNKVVIVQLLGTWCPNCVDETKFLGPFYEKYQSKGLEIVGLAFERTDDFTKAVSNIERLKNRFKANYEFLITMKSGSVQASEALPMLNKVMAFPTTIYIDKKGGVRKIYTGFYGPATGERYARYVEETTRFVEKLLAE